MARPRRPLAAALVAVIGTLGLADLASADAPLLPTPAEPPPSYELPSYDLPSYDLPSYEVQPAQPYQPIAPQSYESRPYIPDSVIGPNYVPPTPVPQQSYPRPHGSYYNGPPVHGPAYGGPAFGGPAIAPHGDRYVSPSSIVVPGPVQSHRVRYKDLKNTHPHSIRQTLHVPLRCGSGDICIDVCAPPNCPVVKVKRNGKKIEYDYGDYEVDIIQKGDGEILVDYDD